MMHRFLAEKRRGKTSIVAIIVVACLAVMACGGALVQSVVEARARAALMISAGHFKGIGLALHNYHDTYGAFPPAYVADTSGRPMHSWRVLILPFVEQSDLYDRYDFDEPWDGPNNSLLFQERPAIYANARISGEDPTKTTYQGIVGPGTCFDPMVPQLTFKGITDGVSNTAMLVENFGHPVIWTQPDDTSPAYFLAGKSTTGARRGETIVMKADTSWQILQQSELPTLKAWMTRAAGD